MKLKFTLFLIFIATFINAQYVPNGTFDNWSTDIDGYLDPDDWDCSNLDQNGSANVLQDVGHSGSGFSVKLIAVNVTGVPIPRGGNIEAFLKTYTGSGQPASLKGFWKTSNMAFGDYIFISVNMYNASMGIIASGSTQTSFSSTNLPWTAFDIPLSYSSADAVAKFNIFIALNVFSANSINSVGYVDDIGFDIGTGVNEIQKPFLNPAITHTGNDYSISIDVSKQTDVDFKIISLTGQELIKLQTENLSSGHHNIPFDASDLPSGIYSCLITGGTTQEVVKFQVVR